ncbi:hypothetical protein JCM11251_001985 [Rhodosporidiobolus azoricus]
MPNPPPTCSAGGSSFSSDSSRLSRRVSDLVSHFESASKIRPPHSLSATSQRSSSGRRHSSLLPASDVSTKEGPATTIGGVQHFQSVSAGPETTPSALPSSFTSRAAGSSLRKASAVTSASSTCAGPSPAFLTGNLDEMGWTPRRTAPPPPPFSAKAILPQAPQPAAPASLPRPPPSATRAATKAKAAATVFIPAQVSSNGAEGKTSMEVKPVVQADKLAQDTEEVVKPRSRDMEEPLDSSLRPSPPLPPLSPPSSSSGLHPNIPQPRQPSVGFVDGRSSPSRPDSAPREEGCLSSAPDPPTPSKDGGERPILARAETASSLQPPPLSATSSSKPKRPVLIRGSTSGRLSFTPATAPSSVFTIPPTPSTARSSFGGSSC